MRRKPILRLLSLIVVWLLISWTAGASTLVWTNIAGGNWNVAENWEPNQIPSALDNAFITNAGSYTVVVDSDFGTVDNLVLGGETGGQTLSIAASGLFCNSTAVINPGSLLSISESSLLAFQLELAGTLNYQSGELRGMVIVATTGVLNLTSEGDKLLTDNGSIINHGLIQWDGGAFFGDDLDFTEEHPTVVNMPGATFEIQFEESALGLPSWSSPFNTSFIFQNAGLLRKTVAPGAIIFLNVDFENSGIVQIEQGALRFASQTGAETPWSSSGLFEVGAGAALQLAAGNCTFLPGHMAQGEGYFGIVMGGPLTLNGEIAGKFDWAEGDLHGRLTITANGVLNIFGDADKRIWSGAAITNYGLIQWSGFGALYGEDLDFSLEHPAIMNMAGGVFEIQNDSVLGTPFSIGPEMSTVFHNAGLLRKVAGPGMTIFSTVGFVNSGTVQVEQGTLLFNSPIVNPPAWVSSGLFEVGAGAAVQLGAGNCTFLPGHYAQGAGYFGLEGFGTLTLSGVIAGKLDWNQGIFYGQLTIATNGVLNIFGDADKRIWSGGAITNYGLIQWSGFGALYGEDLDFSLEHPAIMNMAGGVFEIQNDTVLGTPFSIGPEMSTVFHNAGLLRKVAGPGMTIFSTVGFVNSGTVQVEQGTLLFNSPIANPPAWVSSGLFEVGAGAAVQLGAGNCTFLPGHYAQGAGYFGLEGFGTLTLSGVIAGKLDWNQGNFYGRLTIATNGVLNIFGDADKRIWSGGAITNYGLIQWSGFGALYGEDLDFSLEHPAIMNMAGGVFEIQNDTVLGTPFSIGPEMSTVFHNAGLLRKVAGPGMTIFSTVGFVNSGTVQVEQGTLLFNSPIVNPPAWVSSGLFEVGAGAAVQLGAGNCTFLPGHYAQGAGYFGLEGFGTLTLSGVIAGKLDWNQGNFYGRLTIATNGVLNIFGDAEKRIWSGAAITNYGLIQWSGFGALYGEDLDFSLEHPAIMNMAGGVFEIQNDTVLGTPFSSGPEMSTVFHNAGLLRKVAGPGMTIFSTVGFVNSGTVQVEQGTLLFNSPVANPPAWISSGLFEVGAGAAVQLGAGNCTFLPGHFAQGSGYFGLEGFGTLTLSGVIAGKLDWNQGNFYGRLTIATNGVLNIFGDADKRIWSGGAITNYGLIQWSGFGPLYGEDLDFSLEHPAIMNMAGGVFEIQNDSVLGTPFSSGPEMITVLHNAGLLRKVAGPGMTIFNSVAFSGDGALELSSGSLWLDSSSTWVGSGIIELAVFSPLNYSRVQGAGVLNLSGALSVDFQNGYLPSGGDNFELFTYDGSSVAFTNIDLPALPAGLYFATLIDTQHFVLETRQDPVANPDSFPLVEDVPADLDVLANDENLNGQGTIQSFTQPSHGTVTLNPNQTLHYVPVLNYFGNDSFSYVARNAGGGTSSASVALTIAAVNDPPVFAAVPNQTIDESMAFNLHLSATDPDSPANILRFGLLSGPSGMVVFPGGTLLWTPSEAQGPSTNPIVVRVFDNGSPNLSATQAFLIVVNEVNSAPALAPLLNYTISPAEPLNLTFAASDSDLPANTLLFSLDSAPVGASVTSAGAFTWTPGFDQAGTTNTVEVRVVDNGTPSLMATGSFSIVVPNEGLKADYFIGTNFDTLALTTVNPQIDFSWTPGNQFSVRWTGQLIPRHSETYTFSTISDDGVRLWVNGFLVIDNWTVHLSTTNTGTIALAAGQPSTIKLEYFDAAGPAAIHLLWASASQATEIVPASQFICNGYNDVIANGIYRLTPKIATGKCAKTKAGSSATEVEIGNFSNRPWEKWQPMDAGNGYFKIHSQNALSKVIEISGGFTTNGTLVQIASDIGVARQHFKFVDMGQGWFKIQPESAPSSVLQVQGGDSGNGTPVELYEDNGADAQRWRLDRQ